MTDTPFAADSGNAGPLGRPNARAYYQRVRNLLLAPTDEWRAIAVETPSTQQLFVRWVLPFTAFFFIAPQLGSIAFPEIIDGRPAAPSLARALYTIIIGTAFMTGGVWVLALTIDYLAKPFEAKRDPAQAMKLAAYSCTGLWVISGVFGLAPPVALLGALGLVSFYTFWRGLPVLMGAAADKALAYAASVVAVTAVVAVILMALSQCAAMLGGSSVRPSAKAAVVAPVASPVAVKADPAGPIEIDKMRRLLPDAIPGGWVRAGVTRNNGGALGFTGPTVEAVYENGGQRIVLRVIDLGRGRAGDAINALRATTPAFADEEGAVVHGEQQERFTFAQSDRVTGVERWLTVVDDRVVLAAEGSGGVTQGQLAEALGLIDMVRVAQIAKGL